MGLTGGVRSHRLSGQISPYCEKKRHWLCAYCAPMFCHCRSASRASMKQNTSSVVGFIVVALYNTSATCHYCCSKEDFKVVQQTVGKKSFLERQFALPWEVTM